MKFIYFSLVLVSVALQAECLFWGAKWNDLKVTWGINPLGSNNFVSMPRTENEAIRKGWVQEKSCAEGHLGNRYSLNGDRATLLIFGADGNIAGIAANLPKGLAFNFPHPNIQKFFNDEGDSWTISAYFTDPDSVCSSTRQETGDRLVLRSDSFSVNIALKESEIDTTFWTKGLCFYTMGQHYWADVTGGRLSKPTKSSDFVPVFLLYNKGELNGFGWAFGADLPSKRYEHPTTDVLGKFFPEIPDFFYDSTQIGTISTQHIYMDSTPWLNFC